MTDTPTHDQMMVGTKAPGSPYPAALDRAPVPSREPGIPEALGHLDNAIDQLEATISRLEDSLGPILVPATDESVPGGSADPRSVTANVIHDQSYRIDTAINRVRGIINRVDL